MTMRSIIVDMRERFEIGW